MIAYQTRGISGFLNLFKVRGSVFPKAFCFALPNAILTATIFYLAFEESILSGLMTSVNNNSLWTSFSTLVSFLVIFRTSQAYTRFQEGCSECHKMGAEWFDACSALIAYCKYSAASEENVWEFQCLIIRLFSLLHAVALGECEDVDNDDLDVRAFNVELIDGGSLDHESIEEIRCSSSKTELIYQWIQQCIVENMKTGVVNIPAPLLTRTFQELGRGMVHFHEAMRINVVKFPFPYAQTCDMLLCLHWLVVPFIVAKYSDSCLWAGIFAFVLIFSQWSLQLIAIQLENPFGSDDNDVDGERMQIDFNTHLRLLIKAGTLKTPRLQCQRPESAPVGDESGEIKGYDLHVLRERARCSNRGSCQKTLNNLWEVGYCQSLKTTSAEEKQFVRRSCELIGRSDSLSCYASEIHASRGVDPHLAQPCFGKGGVVVDASMSLDPSVAQTYSGQSGQSILVETNFFPSPRSDASTRCDRDEKILDDPPRQHKNPVQASAYRMPVIDEGRYSARSGSQTSWLPKEHVDNQNISS